jgi:hypothetical protein
MIRDSFTLALKTGIARSSVDGVDMFGASHGNLPT